MFDPRPSQILRLMERDRSVWYSQSSLVLNCYKSCRGDLQVLRRSDEIAEGGRSAASQELFE